MPETFSAQLILEPFAPSGVTSELRRALSAAGIEVGPGIGGSFSVTASLPKMEALFGIKIFADPSGNYEVAQPGSATQPPAGEIPLNNLPGTWRRAIKAVVFTRRPDFGP
ncbi:MAG: hypothetical protein JWR00_4135 [Rubritepida sp.]|jgi:hypothetical protein|nr:hypothetical protein [Rubritepida sp.]